MSISVLDMSMSLDGFVSGPNDGPGNPGGDGFAPLHAWMFTPEDERRQSGPAGEMNAYILAAGAVVSGRRTAEQVNHWDGVHHGDGIPVFIPSHRPPDPSVAEFPLITYVADGIVSAMEQAKAAAGDRHVHVIGGYTAQRAFEAGVLDEVRIHLVPVLFGGGRRLIEVLPAQVELEVVQVVSTPEATHLHYRVRR
jgi:dihydrofolate reductase